MYNNFKLSWKLLCFGKASPQMPLAKDEKDRAVYIVLNIANSMILEWESLSEMLTAKEIFYIEC